MGATDNRDTLLEVVAEEICILVILIDCRRQDSVDVLEDVVEGDEGPICLHISKLLCKGKRVGIMSVPAVVIWRK